MLKDFRLSDNTLCQQRERERTEGERKTKIASITFIETYDFWQNA